MKNLIFVFILAFGLNLIWENLHSLLYVHYQGESITFLILLRAALVDGFIILILIQLLRLIPSFSKISWLVILFGVIISIIMEHWALSCGRWAYAETMPIIPLLEVGLTPTIQLGLLAYLTYKLVFQLALTK